MTRLARLLSICALLGAAITLTHPSTAQASPISDPRYFVGVNVPWYTWACDFGCRNDTTRSSPPCQYGGCGGGQGISAPAVYIAMDDQFSRVQEAGIHTVRWWMFQGNAWQIGRDETGAPTSLNPVVYDDLDAALTLAEKHDLAYDLVLFEGPNRIPRAWPDDAAQRSRLADTLAPLFARYRDNPHILSWETFNEPDAYNDNGAIPLQPIRDTIALLASTVHANTSTLVTTGTAHAKHIRWSTGLGLDYYRARWYPHLNIGDACLPCTDAATIAASQGTGGAPIVVAEFNDFEQAQRVRSA